MEVSLGGWCVGGAGEQDGLGAFPQLLDNMLPDVCRKHMPASIVNIPSLPPPMNLAPAGPIQTLLSLLVWW